MVAVKVAQLAKACEIVRRIGCSVRLREARLNEAGYDCSVGCLPAQIRLNDIEEPFCSFHAVATQV